MTEAVAIVVLLAFAGNVAAQGRFPWIAMGWCPVGRVGVVAGTARGSAGEVSSTSLDPSHGDHHRTVVAQWGDTTKRDRRPIRQDRRHALAGARSVDTEENSR